ncbi:transcriptional regulator NrdR [Dethiosulfovibrio salsuginis]|uniref:Transcriptional repressor NrdR n=1 Tax=Dethiosulfovibrio salsuginis TaxID=561720 RepID=A0A1X7J327_9BACT|nr:transcriptional regulator NrdR [Dethiosulfovibrio salsuginis]SMG21628.1 transcriptional repressor NrdR [Dethiosulfovibrio salsuginis]
MRCPKCAASETRVIETRTADEGRIVRRRRECPSCSSRFTTYERVDEKKLLWVFKKDGKREAFDRDKVFRGIRKACEKLPVSLERLEETACRVEDRLLAEGGGEVSSVRIGEIVMEELADLDKVAYVRFASVYREFTDLTSFQNEISMLLDKRKPLR